MDSLKIGKFIAAERKARALTQRELAERLNISDKTVSKWECGNGLPDVSVMLPLCDILQINVNELLSGERLSEQNYLKKAEENMVNLIKEKEENKKKLILSLVVTFITLASAITLILIAGLFEMSILIRAVLIILAILVLGSGIGVACVLDREAGVFECRHCGEKFVPDMKTYIMAPHSITTRRLKCPKCEKTSYCKHRLHK